MRYSVLPTEILKLSFNDFMLNVQIANRKSNTENEYENRVNALLMEKKEADRKRASIKKS